MVRPRVWDLAALRWLSEAYRRAPTVPYVVRFPAGFDPAGDERGEVPLWGGRTR